MWYLLLSQTPWVQEPDRRQRCRPSYITINYLLKTFSFQIPYKIVWSIWIFLVLNGQLSPLGKVLCLSGLKTEANFSYSLTFFKNLIPLNQQTGKGSLYLLARKIVLISKHELGCCLLQRSSKHDHQFDLKLDQSIWRLLTLSSLYLHTGIYSCLSSSSWKLPKDTALK